MNGPLPMLPGQSSIDLSVDDITKFRPLADVVVIQFDEPPSETESGIALPESVSEHMAGAVRPATVVMLGAKCNLSLSADDRVLVHRVAGDYLTVGQSEYRLVPSEEVLCVISEDSESD